MENLDVLKDLFDEKIIRIMNVFIVNPDKQFYLSEIAKFSKINISTTFRVLNRLSLQGFLRVTVIGKVRMYQLERNDKTRALINFIKKDKEDPLEFFIEKVKTNSRIKALLLESKTENSARLLIVGDYILKERIQRIINEIKEKYNFNITFTELFENQFKDLKEFKSYGFDKKIIWKRIE